MFNTLSIKHISPLKIKLYDQKWLHMKCWCIVCILSTSLFHTVYWHMHCTVTCLTEQYRQTINRLESSGSLYKVWQRALWRDEGAGAARDAKMSLSHWMTMAIFFVVFTWSKLSCFFHRHTCPKKRNSAAGVLVFWVGEEVGWGREGRRRAGGGRGGKGGRWRVSALHDNKNTQTRVIASWRFKSNFPSTHNWAVRWENAQCCQSHVSKNNNVDAYLTRLCT